ncbi:MAG: type I 3-dehydroquinate dehydratase [Bacteroidales bacterium]|nr:type I 3-dehydroquinate dehydratase [Bacteroidales bacterium]
MIKEILVFPFSDFLKHEEITRDKKWAELRLDVHQYQWIEYVHLLFLPIQWIVSFRSYQQLDMFEQFLSLRPTMIDLPFELATDEYILKCQSHGIRCMISYHSNQTIEEAKGFETLKKMRSLKADLYKMVFTAKSWEDNEAIKKLYDEESALVAFNMGRLGKESRIYAAFNGERMIYLAPDGMTPLAEGQLYWSEWQKIKETFHV